MKLAFCLFNYFPYGGLQRDFMRIMLLCQQRGHTVDVYTMRWEGEFPAGITIHKIPVCAFTHHTRNHRFSRKVMHLLKKQNYDVVIGFNRMPGLDIYFAADVCFAWQMQQRHARYIRYLPRYHTYLMLERALFYQAHSPQILFLTPLQQNIYQQYYPLAADKIHLLPPGLDPDWCRGVDKNLERKHCREELGLNDQDILLLSVGSHFITKGIERSIYAYAALPESIRSKAYFFIVGQGNEKPCLQLAKSLGISNRLFFLGSKPKVLPFMLAADLLLHPAHHESAGMVLIEALASGLGVITTADCGYAFHIKQANAGIILTSPFSQTAYNNALLEALSQRKTTAWRQNALTYAAKTDLSGLHESVVNIIEGF
ncbi:MAG: rfaG [Gammaproteobacteria bacterium]|jgi:UDP-glucose:(heptosyl)LPS alpha-1,3-glucosyltransferase|nr:rfaG [Gammaproteobacteria bacterium]